nr:hypothetical protein [Halorubrum sp. CGM5_25_10-8B]
MTVDGEVPTPKTGRRYWYTAYGEAVYRVAERFADVAEEQGSKSAEVVLDNYLSEAEKRRHRREEMRADLGGSQRTQLGDDVVIGGGRDEKQENTGFLS